MPDMRYPTDHMNSVSQKMNSILTDALQQHNTLVNSSVHPAIDNLPTAIQSTFRDHFDTWEQQIQNSYASLKLIADRLGGAASVMSDQEQQFTQSLQPNSEG